MMARTAREGLEYFPMDVDFYDDPKLLIVEERFGIKGIYMTSRLLCWVYRSGYFMAWNTDMALAFSKRVGHNVSHSLANNLVNTLAEKSFFNKDLFSRYSILTSKGIQKRWSHIIATSKRKAFINPIYNLLDASEAINTSSECIPSGFDGISSEKTGRNATKESKVNKSKVNPPYSPPMDLEVGSSCLKVDPSCLPTEKEEKEKSCAKKEKIELPFSSERFAKAWKEWKEYKAKEHGFRYKSSISEKTALTQLKNKSQNKEPLALAIIEQSIANGWEGMFALKAEDLNKQKHLYDLPPKDSHIRKLG